MASSKVYVGNLGQNGDKETIEQEFSKFGLIKDVWIARNPPGFAFIVYNDPRDAEEAVRIMDNKRLCGSKIKVELSHTEDSRRGDRGGRGRGHPRHDRDRGPPLRSSARDKSPPRMQFSRGSQFSEPTSRRALPPTRGMPPRGPPMRGPPPRATTHRRSEERFDRGPPYGDRYNQPAAPRDRFGYERSSSRQDDEYDGYRNSGYRGGVAPANGFEKYSERYSDRHDDRYGPPPPQERYRESVPDRPPPRGMERGSDRFTDRRPERSMNRGPDRFGERYQEARFSRRSPPPRGPPLSNSRMLQRSPPSRRGGRSPIARNWGRSRSPLR